MDRRSFLGGALAGASGAALLGSAGAYAYERQLPDAAPALPGPPARPSLARESFAQQGEDLVMFHVLRDLMRIEQPTYLDIGAADPVASSNTYLFYRGGASGVLVEPNPAYVARLREVRPRDIVVAAGIGVGDAAEADYYVMRGAPTLNTFSRQEAERLARDHPGIVERVVKMPLLPVNAVIARCLGKAPDCLSIDVEGLDLAILRTLDFAACRPAVIVAETIRMGTPHTNPAIGAFLASKGYIARGGSPINTVFADPGRYA